MAPRLEKLDDIIVEGIKVDVWKQGNLNTLVLDAGKIDSRWKNIFAFQFKDGDSTLDLCIDKVREKINQVKDCAHIIEPAVSNGRKVSKCRYCDVEL